MSEEATSIVLEELRILLKEQKSEMVSIQNRASLLVQWGGLLGGLLSLALAKNHPTLGIWEVLAGIFFSALLIVALFILWPRKYKFQADTIQIASNLVRGKQTDEISKALFTKMVGFELIENVPKSKRMTYALLLAIVLLTAELFSLIVGVWMR